MPVLPWPSPTSDSTTALAVSLGYVFPSAVVHFLGEPPAGTLLAFEIAVVCWALTPSPSAPDAGAGR